MRRRYFCGVIIWFIMIFLVRIYLRGRVFLEISLRKVCMIFVFLFFFAYIFIFLGLVGLGFLVENFFRFLL